jgi:orotate phosphoribosyltransferase
MASHTTSRSWTDEDIARLRELSQRGASVARAAAALNRKTAQVAKKARQYGLPLIGTRQMKAAVRSLDPKAAFSSSY